MGRAMLIVALVGLFTLSSVAAASPVHEVRLPIGVDLDTETATAVVVVRSGDHLWKISERHLEDRSPSTPVGPYWRRVVETNTPRLRSGDPDLIYPGEEVTLPVIADQR